MQPILEIQDLRVSFRMYDRGLAQRDLAVLSDLTLSVRPGEVVAVAGSSGSGKSLLASAILGLARPSARAVGRRFVTLLLQAGGASLRASLRRDQLRYRARRRGRVYTVDFNLDAPGFDRREVGVLVSRIASGLGVSDRYELHALPRRSSFSLGYSWRFSFDLKDRDKGGRHG